MARKTRIVILSVIFVISVFFTIKTHSDLEKRLFRLKEPVAPVELAKTAVEKYLLEGKMTVPAGIQDVDNQNTGVFVTIINKENGLRGCVGSIPSLTYFNNTADEIVNIAIRSAVNDKRFDPVSKEELENLAYSVDILEKPVDIKSTDELDPKKFGVIVFSGKKAGILLPDIKGVNTPEQQIKYAKINGNIRQDEEIDKIQKFAVQRFNS